MPRREHAAQQVADGRRPQAAVRPRRANGFRHPGRAFAAEVHEPDPNAVAVGGGHARPDGAEAHLVEAEAPRVGAVGEQTVGVCAARQRAVHREGDPVARLLEQGLNQVPLQHDVAE